MNNLLKLEFRKLKKQKSFYICTVIMIVLLFFSAVTTKMLTNADADFAAQTTMSGIASAVSAVSGCSFLLIAGIFAALFVCDDYEQQTIKNFYSRGYTKTQVYFSKFISVWIACSIMFVLVVLFGFLFGKTYFGTGSISGTDFIAVLLVQYITCMANISLFSALSFILRKNGSSIAAVIVAPMLVNMVLGMADSFLKLEDTSLTNLWVSSFMNDLSALTVEHSRLIVCFGFSVVYIIVFMSAGSFLHKKIEI